MTTTTATTTTDAATVPVVASPTASFTMERKQLAAILARIVDTAPTRSPKAVLQDVKISVNGQVTFVANDLERYHVETCSPDSRGEIDVMVNAKQLRKAVTSNKAKQLTLVLYDDAIRIGGQSIPVKHDVDEFPGCDSPAGQCERHIPADVLVTLLERTLFACDTESSRYALGGVLVEMDLEEHKHVEPTYLRLVGTDGRRLATDYIGDHAGNLVSVIWPYAAANGALKALRKAESCVLSISEGNNSAYASTDEAAPKWITLLVYLKDGTTAGYVMRTMEGRFPKWRDVIPQFPPVCSLEADKLAALFTGALAATSEESRGADICCADDVLTASTSDSENGTYFGDIVVASEQTTLDITLDCRFVLDWAKACKGYVLTINARDIAIEDKHHKQADHAVRIECGSADYILMPLARDRVKKQA